MSEDWNKMSEDLEAVRVDSTTVGGHFDTNQEDSDSARRGWIFGARAAGTAILCPQTMTVGFLAEHESRGTFYPKHAGVGGSPNNGSRLPTPWPRSSPPDPLSILERGNGAGFGGATRHGG